MAVIVVSLIGSCISMFCFRKLDQASDWNVHSYQVLRKSDDMLMSRINIETGVRGFVASGDEAFLEPYKMGTAQFAQSFDAVKNLTADNPAQQKRLDEMREMSRKIAEVDEKLIALRKDVSAGTTPAQTLTDYFKEGHDKQFMDRYRAITHDFNEAEESLLNTRSAEVSTLSDTTAISLGIAGLLTILISVVLGTLITRGIMRALGGEPVDAAAVARSIAEGDLAVPVHLAANDRGSLMASLEAMKKQLSSIVRGIQSSSESISVAAGEIAQGNTDLSQRTEEQAASLEETAASMEELTATVRQTTENAKEGNTLAGNASGVAVRGGEVVGRVVKTMHEISDSSTKVVQIISVIEGIAFQTNILALNAAVEAARAGSEGRGFAVVASEVRTLAQRSASAAKEIKELIGQSVERVTMGSKLVEEAGTTMNEIVHSVRRVTEIMGEIASASSEQSTGIEQVNQAVAQMDQVTQQNAALVEQATAAAQAMAEQATSLRGAVAVFKTGTDGQPVTVAAARKTLAHRPAMGTLRRA
jgi:methyl-accepting chemotaxis protein